jgi:NhaA family Na+:H+ antiporter
MRAGAQLAGDGTNQAASAELPEQPVRRLVQPIVRFLRIEAASGAILIAAILAAVGAANAPAADSVFAFWSMPVSLTVGSHVLGDTLRGAINEGLMTLFFFVVGLEIKRELVLGELRTPRVAALPIAAALGGMAVPALVYLALQWGLPGARDWGVVMATDIAFVIGCLALLGTRVPHSLRVFVLSLAIIDDIGAVLVIVLFYSQNVALGWLALGAAAIAAVFGLRKLGVRSIPIYFVVGIFAWFAVHESGLHATLVGIVLGLMTPSRPWVGAARFSAIMRRTRDYLGGETADPDRHERDETSALLDTVARAAHEMVSPLERLEAALHPWVSFAILPLFALANAGVKLTAAEFGNPVVIAVLAGLVIGKPTGILGASWIAVRMGLARKPAELGWPLIAGAGVLCGIGFTMALFIANLAFDASLLVAASVGILAASVVSAVIGLGLLGAILGRRRPPAL